MRCPWHERGDVELYVYGELDVLARAAFERHLHECETCRIALADIEVLRRVLAGTRLVSAPASGDWAPFMRRLDRALDAATARRPPLRLSGAFRLAATIVIAVVGMWAGFTLQRARHAPETASPEPAAIVPAEPSIAIEPLTSAAGEHLERSKLVLLGLAAQDPGTARPDDWSYERGLASSLLADTTQYRLVAAGRGRLDLAGVLGDLETVLLQASLGNDADPHALERLQRMIARRDLITKIEILRTEGPEDRSPTVGSSGRGHDGNRRND